MGFQAPLHQLSDYLAWTTSGRIQLPDFQRGYKWEDERIRQLLITILRGHPLGVVMLLQTGNDQIRFKPRPIEGVTLPPGSTPDYLLLDGQQRLTSLTQALTGDGVVATEDSRGKKMDRTYYIHIDTALAGEDRIDDAVISVRSDRTLRSNFDKVIDLDLRTDDKERSSGYFPVRLLFTDEGFSWLMQLENREQSIAFQSQILQTARTYKIPAIQLDTSTSKAAVATVFEKVNTGGLPLNVFELLTATFAGDREYYDTYGSDFRLNDDWRETQQKLAPYSVLSAVENTDFLQAVTMLTTLRRNRDDHSGRPPAVSAKREDVLKLELNDYLTYRDPLREAFIWASTFLADQYIFDTKFLPYPKQLVPLAAIKVVLGKDADLISVRDRLAQWFWCGILGELYGSAIESRFVRDLEQVPAWALGKTGSIPKTVQDASFVESRLHSLRTRNAAAYKGVYALLLAHGARDWMNDQAFNKVQYVDLSVDIHHIFPQRWCNTNNIDDERRESIVNKTPLSAVTNRTIGGVAPSSYLKVIERKAQISPDRLNTLLATHLADAGAMREDNFDHFFILRRNALVGVIEKALGKSVQRDVDSGTLSESLNQFDPENTAVAADQDDWEER
ncbi:DUF262 domain-containing protein [Hoyosella sp. YIM 151337]|uniref:GmrSD restriction endonuclease domain-containing protein n=1 Tax=Hoyosella sp. YIM 151337 TaxID=2992742 RepID=UPI002235A898|nr:DUF262 domain-containing protein [Hoyosella sp. YIM 151337]MCW4354174.1 DUF262 domain-containing protein [Hoyosella sp. YIM 151337]